MPEVLPGCPSCRLKNSSLPWNFHAATLSWKPSRTRTSLVHSRPSFDENRCRERKSNITLVQLTDSPSRALKMPPLLLQPTSYNKLFLMSCLFSISSSFFISSNNYMPFTPFKVQKNVCSYRSTLWRNLNCTYIASFFNIVHCFNFFQICFTRYIVTD